MLIGRDPSPADYAPTNPESSNLLKQVATLYYCAIGTYRRCVVDVFLPSQAQCQEYSLSHNFCDRDNLMQQLAVRDVKEMTNEGPIHFASGTALILPS